MKESGGGLDIWWGCGKMVGMNKIKYWLLVVAALVKAFTSPILLFGSAFVTQGSVLSDVLLVARMASDNLNAAERMQIDVVELLALICLDLHQIWDFDE